MVTGLRWLTEAEPRKVLRVLVASLLGAAAAVFAFLALTGRAYYLLGTLAALSPFLGQLPRLFRWLKTLGAAGGKASGGGKSRVNTAWLAMALDHGTGAMAGEVLQGRYQGRQLNDMTQAELVDLLQEVGGDDTQSAALVEAYLDRMFPDWRQHSGDQAQGAGTRDQAHAGSGGSQQNGSRGGNRRRAGAAGGMTREQAYEILGLSPGADRDAIRDAHRRLIRQVHPDAGGSDFLAAQINQAKEVLLDEP